MSAKPIQPQVYSNRQIFRMVLPLILSLMIEQVIGFTDVAFLGRVGETELGASALAGVMYLALIMVGFGYSFSMQAYMGQKNGERDWRAIGLVFHNGTAFLLGFSVVLFIVALLFSEPFLSAVTRDAAVARATDQYFFWRVIGVPFTFLCAVSRAFFIATLRPKILTTASVIMMLANIVLDYVLIFGWGPIPALGIRGAAIASSLSEAIAMLVYAVYAIKFMDAKQYGLLEPLRWDWGMQKKLFSLGRWLMIQEGIAFVAWLYFFICVEHLGAAALAISNVVRQTSSIFYLLVHSFGSTGGAIGANLIGERRFDEIPSMLRRTLGITVAVIAPFYLLVAFFPESILSIFTNIPEIIEGSVTTLYVLLGAFFVIVPCMFYNFAMGGMGLTKETSLATTAATLSYSAYIFVLSLSTTHVEVMWTSEYVYNIVVGVVCFYFWRQRRWRVL